MGRRSPPGGGHFKSSGWSQRSCFFCLEVRCLQRGEHLELNSYRAAAIPGQVCRSPEIFLGTWEGDSGMD